MTVKVRPVERFELVAQDIGISILDTSGLSQLAKDIKMDTIFLAKIEKRQKDGQLVVFGANRGGAYVGMVCLILGNAYEKDLRETLPGTPTLSSLWVEPEHRRSQIGSGLMIAAEKYAIQLGFQQIALSVEPENETARAMYQKRGFEEFMIGGKATIPSYWEVSDGDMGSVWVCLNVIPMIKRL